MPSNSPTKQDRLRARKAGQLFTQSLCSQASGSWGSEDFPKEFRWGLWEGIQVGPLGALTGLGKCRLSGSGGRGGLFPTPSRPASENG